MFPPCKVTLRFNLARTWEDLGRVFEAKRGYEKLVRKHPAYIEAYMRLGILAKEAGQHSLAIKWLTMAQGLHVLLFSHLWVGG